MYLLNESFSIEPGMREYPQGVIKENIQVATAIIDIASVFHITDSSQGNRVREVSQTHIPKAEPTTVEPPCVITTLFEHRARLQPFAAAVQFENEPAITFASLNHKSDRIAAALSVSQGSVVPGGHTLFSIRQARWSETSSLLPK